jgi:hypothetical protein
MVEIPTLKPYIFMIRVTRQIKCLIALDPGVIPHPLPEVNFLIHYVYNISIHLSLSLIFDSSTTLVQMMPLLSKLLVHEWNKHNSIKVLYLFFVYCWVILLQHDKIHNYTLKRGLLYMMSKRSLFIKANALWKGTVRHASILLISIAQESFNIINYYTSCTFL